MLAGRGLWLGVALLLSACADSPPIQPTALARVWPEAPQQPRVRFEKFISTPAELGIRKSALARLGEFLFGQQQSRLVRPMAVVVIDETIYVADPGVRAIHRMDQKNGTYTLITGPNGSALPSPVGLAVGANGDVYVADSALAGVFVIRKDADEALPLALSQVVKQPTGLAFDQAQDELFVVDTTQHVINVFSSDGRWKRSFGGRGREPGQFNHPTLLWRDASGSLFVADALNFRVQVLDAQGHAKRQFGRQGDGTGHMARHKGVATDRHGHVYVVDSLFSTIQIFDSTGQYLLSVGELGQGSGQFWLPGGIYIDANDLIYVADAYNSRIQVFRYVGDES